MVNWELVHLENLGALLPRGLNQQGGNELSVDPGMQDLAKVESREEVLAEGVLVELKARLKNESWEVRRETCREIGQRFANEPDLMAPLLPAVTELLDNKVLVRREAIQTLGAAGSLAKSSVPALLECLEKEDCYGKREIAQTLGAIGSLKALPALASIIEKTERPSMACKAAARAIKQIIEFSQ